MGSLTKKFGTHGYFLLGYSHVPYMLLKMDDKKDQNTEFFNTTQKNWSKLLKLFNILGYYNEDFPIM